MNKEQLISEMLLLPSTAIDYHTSEHLRSIYPDKALVEGEMHMFNVEGYAKAGLCVLTPKTFLYNQMSIYWQGPEPAMMHPHQAMRMHGGMMSGMNPFDMPQEGEEGKTDDSINKAWFDVVWQEHTLEILIIGIEGNGMYKNHFWLLADTEVVARDFYAAVCKWNMEIRAEVLVFDNGHWHKDEHLFQDIKNSTFENLILRGTLKQEIRSRVNCTRSTIFPGNVACSSWVRLAMVRHTCSKHLSTPLAIPACTSRVFVLSIQVWRTRRIFGRCLTAHAETRRVCLCWKTSTR